MTEEQVALVAKARESAETARLVRENGHPTIAVSLAYYAMFHAAEALLLSEGLRFAKHGAVVAALGQRFAKTGRLPSHLHRYLIEGMEARHLADYSTTPLADEEAREQVRRAEEFLAAVEHALCG